MASSVLERRIFISDVHMSSDRAYGKRWASFDPATHAKKLEKFLESQVLNKEKTVTELVLLGDIFDNWYFPLQEEPDGYDDILAAEGNQGIINLLRKIADETSIAVSFLPGNHDYDLDLKTLARLSKKIRYYENGFQGGRYRALHGHEHLLINGIPPSLLGPLDALPPAGHFISRGLTSAGKTHGRSVAYMVKEFFDNVVDALRTQNIILEAVKAGVEAARLGNASCVVLPRGETITVRELKDLYAEVGESMRSDTGAPLFLTEWDLKPIAKYLYGQGCKVSIMGHTHAAEMTYGYAPRPGSLHGRKRTYLYVNSGAWCQRRAHYAEVLTIQDRDRLRYEVALVEVDSNGKPKSRKAKKFT